MSSTSSNLSLPYIQSNQAQKHVTHNESLRILDSLTQLSVIDVDRTEAPSNPQRGDSYIVSSPAIGAWENQDNMIAVWDENYWRFFTPQDGWMAWDQGQQTPLAFSQGQWIATVPPLQNLDMVGVNTTADTNNRLAVASTATLFTHDGAGHQLKLNKATSSDTASLLLQTNWAGHAEMGLIGTDNFSIKTSPDGNAFNISLLADKDTGAVSFPSGVTDLTIPEFGTTPLLTVGYSQAKGLDLVTNGTGVLGNNYNHPSTFSYDPLVSPELPASFCYSGYGGGLQSISEFLPVNPHQVYKISTYLRQETLLGDWSTYSNDHRHSHSMGLLCYDLDYNLIYASQHMRRYHAGVDSYTYLTSPLSPGDSIVHVSDAAGWNTTNNSIYHRGMIIFGYKNSQGGSYADYSRIVDWDMFELSGVDKTNNQITLKAPLPTNMGNPDDPNGVWPAGTPLANAALGTNFKYSVFNQLVPAQSDTWYYAENHMGGVDRSGRNIINNFPPGTAFAKAFWTPNYSNRPGGWNGYPDTGAAHKVWFAGTSVVPEPVAATSVASDGRILIKVPNLDFDAGTISLQTAALKLRTL